MTSPVERVVVRPPAAEVALPAPAALAEELRGTVEQWAAAGRGEHLVVRRSAVVAAVASDTDPDYDVCVDVCLSAPQQGGLLVVSDPVTGMRVWEGWLQPGEALVSPAFLPRESEPVMRGQLRLLRLELCWSPVSFLVVGELPPHGAPVGTVDPGFGAPAPPQVVVPGVAAFLAVDALARLATCSRTCLAAFTAEALWSGEGSEDVLGLLGGLSGWRAAVRWRRRDARMQYLKEELRPALNAYAWELEEDMAED